MTNAEREAEVEKMQSLLAWMCDVGRFGPLLKTIGGKEERDPTRRYINLGYTKGSRKESVVWVADVGWGDVPVQSIEVILREGLFLTRGTVVTAEALVDSGVCSDDLVEALSQLAATKMGAGKVLYDAGHTLEVLLRNNQSAS
jgi:hypothetical protein